MSSYKTQIFVMLCVSLKQHGTYLKKTEKTYLDSPCINCPFTNVHILYPIHQPMYSSFISEAICQNTSLCLGSFTRVSFCIRQLVTVQDSVQVQTHVFHWELSCSRSELCSTTQDVTIHMTTRGSCCMMDCRTRNLLAKIPKAFSTTFCPWLSWYLNTHSFGSMLPINQ